MALLGFNVAECALEFDTGFTSFFKVGSEFIV